MSQVKKHTEPMPDGGARHRKKKQTRDIIHRLHQNSNQSHETMLKFENICNKVVSQFFSIKYLSASSFVFCCNEKNLSNPCTSKVVNDHLLHLIYFELYTRFIHIPHFKNPSINDEMYSC